MNPNQAKLRSQRTLKRNPSSIMTLIYGNLSDFFSRADAISMQIISIHSKISYQKIELFDRKAMIPLKTITFEEENSFFLS